MTSASSSVHSSDLWPGYTAVQAEKIVGLSRRRLQYLAAKGLVVPSIQRPGGRRRYYSFFELVELRAIRKLTDGDDRTSLQKIRAVVAALREIQDRPLLTCTLIVSDGRVYWVDHETDAVIDVQRGFQSVLVAVNLGGLESEIRRLLALEHLPLPVEARAA